MPIVLSQHILRYELYVHALIFMYSVSFLALSGGVASYTDEEWAKFVVNASRGPAGDTVIFLVKNGLDIDILFLIIYTLYFRFVIIPRLDPGSVLRFVNELEIRLPLAFLYLHILAAPWVNLSRLDGENLHRYSRWYNHLQSLSASIPPLYYYMLRLPCLGVTLGLWRYYPCLIRLEGPMGKSMRSHWDSLLSKAVLSEV